MTKKHYYYLHENGDLIYKPAIVVEYDSQYFDSPFVKYVWNISMEDRLDSWRMLVEACVKGGRFSRIKELAGKWGCTLEDLPNYLIREPQITEERSKGIGIFIDKILEYDYDEILDFIAKTPTGEEPNMRKFMENYELLTCEELTTRLKQLEDKERMEIINKLKDVKEKNAKK